MFNISSGPLTAHLSESDQTKQTGTVFLRSIERQSAQQIHSDIFVHRTVDRNLPSLSSRDAQRTCGRYEQTGSHGCCQQGRYNSVQLSWSSDCYPRSLQRHWRRGRFRGRFQSFPSGPSRFWDSPHCRLWEGYTSHPVIYGPFTLARLQRQQQLEAKDVLPNISRTDAAERAEKMPFCPW